MSFAPLPRQGSLWPSPSCAPCEVRPERGSERRGLFLEAAHGAGLDGSPLLAPWPLPPLLVPWPLSPLLGAWELEPWPWGQLSCLGWVSWPSQRTAVRTPHVIPRAAHHVPCRVAAPPLFWPTEGCLRAPRHRVSMGRSQQLAEPRQFHRET